MESLQGDVRVWSEKIEARFWNKVNKTLSCWWWLGAFSSDGYGTYGIGEKTIHGSPKTMSAHRFSYCLANNVKKLPTKLDCLHSCDNPKCVNPSHLRLDTRSANIRDMCSKGRGRPGTRAGMPRAVLSESQVRQIIAKFNSKFFAIGQLAREYKVTHKTVANIVQGKSWKNLGNTLT